MSYAGTAARGKRAPTLHSAGQGSSPRPPSNPRPRGSVAAPQASGGQAAVFAAGIIVGIALGAGAALLFAPQAGSDTRRSLARRGARLGRRGRDAWDDLRDELRRAVRRRRRARERALRPADDLTGSD
jgi:hypothetical protein